MRISNVKKILESLGYHEDNYDSENDKILSRGKFEREPIATLYFYNAFMNGYRGEFEFEHEQVYEITKEDKEACPSLRGFSHYILVFRDDGFVVGEAIPKSERVVFLEHVNKILEEEEVEEESL